MPGNEVGDKVHNFFAQENLSQGQHNSQSLDGNWPVLNNNLWAGNQRPAGVLSANAKNYYLQQPDTERGQVGNPLHGQHGLNFAQSTSRPEFVKSQSQSQRSNLNGFIYGNQFYQTRQDETNFLAVDANSDQRNLSSRGMSIYGSQQVNGPESRAKSSVRSETSGSPVSFDFFGGQQQMNNQHSSMLQSLQRQQSGLNDMQQLQQQVMFMKMQELQRQQQLQQLDARQQNIMNQIPAFTKQASGSQSLAMVNGSLNSDALGYHWANELSNANWPQRNSSAIQRSSNGLVFSPNHSQVQRVVDLVPQQVEQSLYGVPISSSRGSLNQYSLGATDKHSVQQLATFGNSIPGNQYNVFPGQANPQDGISIAGPRFQSENSLGHVSGQSLTAINMENPQQVNSMQRNASLQEFHGRQELDVPPETLQEKTETLVGSSQDDVALDPTEERILFGSDDNIWGAFGKSPNMGEGCNSFDGAGINGFPSIQSGSWSALMQSAVAETSSGNVGLQEEWSGLHIQNTDVPSGSQHALACNDGGKQPIHLADDSLPPMVSSLNTGAVPSSNDTRMNSSNDTRMIRDYQNVPGFQQFGGKFSSESGQRLQANSSQGLGQSFEEGGRWSNGVPVQKWVAEGSQIRGNALHSFDAENKSISNPLAQENSGSRQSNKSNGWNVFGSVTPYGDAAFVVHGGGNSSQYSQGNDQKQVMQRELAQVGNLWRPNSVCDSTVELEQLKSFVGNAQVNNEGFSLNNAAVSPDLTTIRTGEGSSQFLPNNYEVNYWKSVDLGASKASDVVGRSLQENKNFSSKEVGKGHEVENNDKQENSNDSHRSNLSHHASAGGPRENMVSDASDSRTMSAGKQKASNQMAWKNSAPPRKFQYHPMGNLDDDQEPLYATKQPMHPQGMSHLGQANFSSQVPKSSIEMEKGQSPDLQRSPKGFNEALSQGIFPGSLPDMSAPFNRSGDTRAPNKASQPSQNMLELLNKVDQSREHSALMHATSSELNASSEMPQAETSDGSVSRLQRSQSSNSQGFGLQLGPPSQRLPVPNHSLPSQSSLQMVSSLHSSHTSPEMGQKAQGQLASASLVHPVPPSTERSQGESMIVRSGVHVQTGNETSLYKMPGNMSSAFNPGFPYPGHLQKQETGWKRGQVSGSLEKHASHSMQKEDHHGRLTTSQSAETSLPDEAGSIMNNNNLPSGNTSRHFSMNIFPEKVSPLTSGGEPVRVTQPSSMTGLSLQGSSKALPNMWANIAAQHLLGAKYRKIPSQFPPSFQASIANSSSSGSPNQGDHDANKGGKFPSELGAGSVNSQGLGSEEEQSVKKSTGQQASSENVNLVQEMTESQGKEPVVRTPSDGSPANSASIQRDIQAFGRSLKSNNLFPQNYSLLNQIQAIKDAQNDPSQRVLKRMKGPDNGLGDQTVASNVGQSNDPNATTGTALVPSHASAPPGDSTMLSFPTSANTVERNAPSEHGNLVSQGMFAHGQDVSQSGDSMTYYKVDHSKISPQMAPSWFNQYGTFKNGQILPMCDAQRTAALSTGEQPFTLGKSSSSLHTLHSMEQMTAAASDTNQGGIIRQNSTPLSVPIEHFYSQILPTSVSGQHAVVARTKKRKSAAYEHNPWHKEVSQGSQNLQIISMAELDWAKAASRLIEKVEEDVEFMEDGQLMLRSRRRLILTTQLMQQLFRAPPAAILSTDANSDYESVAYLVSRLALGDVCGALTISLANSESILSPDGINGPSGVCRPSERVDDQLLSKVMQEFSARAKKLENDFLQLDKRASVLDLIVDCQELEKFSVINRFAKFHGRGQAESAETASSSDPATNMQKPFPQRYVTALPLPRSLPTRVQCHSL